MTRYQFAALGTAAGFFIEAAGTLRADNPLETYVRAPDTSFNWKQTEHLAFSKSEVFHLELISQTWRGQFWSHHLQVLRPAEVRHPGLAFLYITGDGTGRGDLDMLNTLAERAGAVAAVLTEVPNQPLYNGLREDALIAYTFDQYLRTGDESWPLLFPMVKSAVRAMDTLQAFARKEWRQEITQFVVSGASKRGWTTWLTGAVEPRVKGIAPMVIDVLNMKAQLRAAEKAYGKQSEQIHDYTELRLHEKLDDPPMQRLRSWIDPYAYRDRYTMPKLLLLGTNDPYWMVDSLRYYWNDLPEPKLVYQTPNAGHDLAGGKQAVQTLAAWFQMIADEQRLPSFKWKLDLEDAKAQLAASTDRPAIAFRLWSAHSSDRDFRDEKWTSRDLDVPSGAKDATAKLEVPREGYNAYLMEVELKSSTGDPYKLSTEATVLPANR